METKQNGKKRPAGKDAEDESSSEDEFPDEQSDSDTEEADDVSNKNINVEFEAQTPMDKDFHGIKQLLERLFVTQHIDVSQLADLIISQNHLGSTIKLVPDDDEEDREGDAGDDEEEVFGVSTVLAMSQHSDKACVQEIKKGLLSKCKSNAPDTLESFRTILETKKVGLFVNERFINIPAQFAVPLHHSLREEFEETVACDDTSVANHFKLDYLLIISKTLQMTESPDGSSDAGVSSKQEKKSKKKKKELDKEVEYTNIEEELFHAASEVSFGYSVTEATGLAIGGTWDVGGQLAKPQRTVMLVPELKWKKVLQEIEELIGGAS